MNEEAISELILNAFEARTKSYCPYSGYAVGAALLTESGQVFMGCNVENSSYGATICAERCAALKAVSEGERSFKAIAIVGAPRDAKEVSDYAYPCGICRQFLSEFGGSDMTVIVAKSIDDRKVFSLGELLPEAFSSESMK
ncbi:MAG: cytidine deaminase [Lachnospiraceae bacterium]|nr:cytidine deaminase [Lachnospiraceae bacterium]